MSKTICLDLDGVLADYSKGWQGVDYIGDPLPGAVEFTKRLIELGEVVIFTVRCNPEIHKETPLPILVQFVRTWLAKHGFHYSSIYAGVGKPIAAAYVDDHAVYCGVAGLIEPTKSCMDDMYRSTVAEVRALVED